MTGLKRHYRLVLGQLGVFTTFRAAIYMLRSGKYTKQKIAETLGLPERQMEDLEKALTLPPEEINPFKVLLELPE